MVAVTRLVEEPRDFGDQPRPQLKPGDRMVTCEECSCQTPQVTCEEFVFVQEVPGQGGMWAFVGLRMKDCGLIERGFDCIWQGIGAVGDLVGRRR